MGVGLGTAAGILQRPAEMRRWKPGVALARFVEEYSLREDWLGGGQIYNPLPARVDCFLQFYLADRYRVVTVASGDVHDAPRCVLVGPHTRRREDLVWTGHLKVFTVRFSAVGFRALFGVPAEAIRDYAGAAEAVLGAAVRELEERLAGVGAMEMAGVAEAFLLGRLGRGGTPDSGGVALRMAGSMKRRHGGVAVVELAEMYGFSVRQVERMFQEQVGVSPKVYARLMRLRRAMLLGAREMDWAEVAMSAGYFDQSHMVREFQALNGTTPREFRALGKRALELRSAWGGEGDVAFVLSGVEAGLVA